MAVSLQSVKVDTKINFTTRMQVAGRTVYNAYTFMGNVNYTLANAVAGDLRALVNSTKAYFRAGSSTDETKITYIVVKASESAPSVVIPEPLLDLDSLAIAGDEIFDIVVRDKVTQQQLQQILSGNGLTDFAINVRQV